MAAYDDARPEMFLRASAHLTLHFRLLVGITHAGRAPCLASLGDQDSSLANKSNEEIEAEMRLAHEKINSCMQSWSLDAS